MFCPNCGTQLADDAAFCSNCGAQMRLAGSSVPPAVSGQTPPAMSPAATPSGTSQTVAKKKLPIVPIVAVVALIGLAAALFLTRGFGLFGGSGVEVKASVNDYTWEELSAISEEISQTGSQLGAIEIAKKYHLCEEDGSIDGTQTKNVILSDGTETKVQIIGFNHDDKADGSGKAGITFLFVDIITDWPMNENGSNDGGWQDSSIRSWFPDWIEDAMPEEVLDVVVEVKKKTNNTGETLDVSSVTVSKESFWLLSYNEIVGPNTEEIWYGDSNSSTSDWFGVLSAEGNQYKLYRDEPVVLSGSNEILTKSQANTTSSLNWWLRSPDPAQSYLFYNVGPGGELGSGGEVSRSRGVVPGFCI